MSKPDQALARLRAELIVEVRSGRITAKEAAKRLGVSRKTYYKWEKRALKGMVEALGERASGRPAAHIDREKQTLQEKSERLEKTVEGLERTLKIRGLLQASHLDKRAGRAEKKQ